MASLDVETLIKGASRIAEMRNEQRRIAKERRSGGNISKQDAIRAADQAGESEVGGLRYEDDRVIADAFGEMQDALQTYSRDEAIRQNQVPYDKMTDNELAERAEGVERPESGKAGVQEALDRLKMATGRFGYRPMFGDAAGVEGRLEDSLSYGPEQIGAEKSLAAELVRRDQGLVDPEMAEANYYRAEAEAQAIARDHFTAGGRGAQADAAIARMPNINRRTELADVATVEGVYVDPMTGRPILAEEPAANIAGSNTPTTGQELNAPARDDATSFVVRQVNATDNPQLAQQALRQQDIQGVTSSFGDKVRRLGATKPFQGKGLANASNIRNLDELDKTIGAIRAVLGPDASVTDVMRKLRLAPAEQQRLGVTMMQMEAAGRQTGNRAFFNREVGPQTGAQVFFNAASALPSAGLSETETPVARAVGKVPKTNTDIVTAFKGLQGQSAQAPFIGAIADDKGKPVKPRINRFVAGTPQGGMADEDIAPALTIQAEARARRDRKPVDEGALRSNIVKARLAKAREERDVTKRADQADAIIRSLPPTARRSIFPRGSR